MKIRAKEFFSRNKGEDPQAVRAAEGLTATGYLRYARR